MRGRNLTKILCVRIQPDTLDALLETCSKLEQSQSDITRGALAMFLRHHGGNGTQQQADLESHTTKEGAKNETS